MYLYMYKCASVDIIHYFIKEICEADGSPCTIKRGDTILCIPHWKLSSFLHSVRKKKEALLQYQSRSIHSFVKERESCGMGREAERAESDMESWGVSMAEEELPLLSLNHVSFLCRSVEESMRFYEDVLGFVLIKQPSSSDFEGSWCTALLTYTSHALISFRYLFHSPF